MQAVSWANNGGHQRLILGQWLVMQACWSQRNDSSLLALCRIQYNKVELTQEARVWKKKKNQFSYEQENLSLVTNDTKQLTLRPEPVASLS